MSADIYAVTWERDGVPYLIDVDEEREAQRLAVALAESGRAAVRITRVQLDMAQEVRGRIWRRVEERLRLEEARP